MKDFNELFKNLSNAEESSDILSRFNKNNKLEERVFEKIKNRKKQFKINIIVSLLFMILGAVSAFYIVDNSNSINIKGKELQSVNLLTESTQSKPQTRKKEIWPSDDIYFSTYDNEADYAVEQVSLTTYEGEDEI